MQENPKHAYTYKHICTHAFKYAYTYTKHVHACPKYAHACRVSEYLLRSHPTPLYDHYKKPQPIYDEFTRK